VRAYLFGRVVEQACKREDVPFEFEADEVESEAD
jgi:hypothetical protein